VLGTAVRAARVTLVSARSEQAVLDAAVDDLAARLRRALEPPTVAAVGLDAAAVRSRLEEPLPEQGMPAGHVLGELEERLEGTLPGTTGGRYFGYVTGGVLPAAALAHAWAAAVDQNPGLWALSPGASELEEVVLGWLAELLGVPLRSGVFTSGATMANIVCLTVARHAVAERLGVDVAADGVRALPALAVYGNAELHLSDRKALRLLGLGDRSVRLVDIDGDHRMRVAQLREAVERDRASGVQPAIVIAQAGSVGIGATDPLEELADVCAEQGLWLHVDGAWGAFLRAARRTAPQAAGLERVDSLAVDGHKWLNLPNGIGFAFLRDPRLHREALAGSAAYLTRPGGAGEDSHELGIEASRAWRGAATWAALKQLGRTGVAALVETSCELAAELAERIERSPRLELVAPVPNVVVNFRYRPERWGDGERLDELNRRLLEEITAAGDVLVTGASFPSGFCHRATVVSWRTTAADVLAVADAVEAAGARLVRSYN
jgi:glutamate/tyrosine decarboxylase-like PLP-dependent enzyme